MTQSANVNSTGSSGTGKVAIYLSAFVCPGAGQFAQRRWIAAIVYAVVFLISSVAFFVYGLRIIALYFRVGFEEVPDAEVRVPIGKCFVFLAVALATWAAGMIDTFCAQRRASRIAEQAGGKQTFEQPQ